MLTPRNAKVKGSRETVAKTVRVRLQSPPPTMMKGVKVRARTPMMAEKVRVKVRKTMKTRKKVM
jgi:hypothetical protein